MIHSSGTHRDGEQRCGRRSSAPDSPAARATGIRATLSAGTALHAPYATFASFRPEMQRNRTEVSACGTLTAGTSARRQDREQYLPPDTPADPIHAANRKPD